MSWLRYTKHACADRSLDLSNLDEETEQQVEVLAVPRWKAVAGIAKIPFLQALASTAVIEVFYDEFFIGLPSSTKYSTLRSAFQFFQCKVFWLA